MYIHIYVFVHVYKHMFLYISILNVLTHMYTEFLNNLRCSKSSAADAQGGRAGRISQNVSSLFNLLCQSTTESTSENFVREKGTMGWLRLVGSLKL